MQKVSYTPKIDPRQLLRANQSKHLQIRHPPLKKQIGVSRKIKNILVIPPQHPRNAQNLPSQITPIAIQNSLQTYHRII
jgi:hypothetical protein